MVVGGPSRSHVDTPRPLELVMASEIEFGAELPRVGLGWLLGVASACCGRLILVTVWVMGLLICAWVILITNERVCDLDHNGIAL